MARKYRNKRNKKSKKYNEKMKDIFKDNSEVGTAGLDKKYTRLTFVCYLREKLLNSPKSCKNNKFILKYTVKNKSNQTKNSKQSQKNKN